MKLSYGVPKVTHKNNWIYIFYLFALMLGVALPSVLLSIEYDSPQYNESIMGFVPVLGAIGGVFQWYGERHTGLKEWATNSKGGLFSLIFITCFCSSLISGAVILLDAGLFANLAIYFLFTVVAIYLVVIRDKDES